jgi:cbb3-type cytochrome oxidase subunit 3
MTVIFSLSDSEWNGNKMNRQVNKYSYTILLIVVAILCIGVVRNIYFKEDILTLFQAIPRFLGTAFFIGGLYILVVYFLFRLEKESLSASEERHYFWRIDFYPSTCPHPPDE